MGNRQAKPNTSQGENTGTGQEGSPSTESIPVTKTEVPQPNTTSPITYETTTTQPTPDNTSKQDAPSPPKPIEEEAPITQSNEADDKPIKDISKEKAIPEEVVKEQEKVEEVVKEEEEVVKEEGSQVSMLPPLQLNAIKQVEEEKKSSVVEMEEDPDLMKPPPLLVNPSGVVAENANIHVVAMKATPVGEASILDSDTNENLMLTSPIIHDQVIFEDPAPVRESEEIQKRAKDPDSVSIDEEISASVTTTEQQTEHLVENSPLESKTSESALIETMSVTSSAVQAEEEYMKGIMGVSLTYPDATSNESVIGSIAVSEQNLDELAWDTSSQKQHQQRPPSRECLKAEDHLVDVKFEVQESIVVVSLCGVSAGGEDLPAVTTAVEIKVEEILKKDTILEEQEEEDSSKATQLIESPSEAEKNVAVVVEAVQADMKQPVCVDLSEDGEMVKLGITIVAETSENQSAALHSQTSVISSKQGSIDLKTPFESFDSDKAEALEIDESSGGNVEIDVTMTSSEQTKSDISNVSKKPTGSKSVSSPSSIDNSTQKPPLKASSSGTSHPKPTKGSSSKGRSGGHRGGSKGRARTGGRS